MNAYCNFHGIGLIPWAPVAAGSLCRPAQKYVSTARSEASQDRPFWHKLSPADEVIIGRVEDLAGKKGWTMTQVALVWVCAKVASPIIGMSSEKRVDENIVTGLTLDKEEMKCLGER